MDHVSVTVVNNVANVHRFVSNTVSGKLLRVTLSPGVSMDTQVREYMLVMVSVLVGSG